MTRIRIAIRIFALAWTLASLAPEARSQGSRLSPRVSLTIKAGEHDRQDTPIRVELPEDRLSPALRERLDRGPAQAYVLRHTDEAHIIRFAQIDRDAPGSRPRLTFILPEPLRAGQEHRYVLQESVFLKSLWSFDQRSPGILDLKSADKPVFRYNAAPVSSPNYGPIQVRDAYIHPAYSPSGALITGDFSSSHPHHRGFFLAYEKTQVGDLKPDFWNIHLGTGKIHADGIDPPVAGPVTARFSARHRWEAKDKATGQGTVVLRERWDVEAYAIQDNPYWLFDVTSTQQAVGKPLLLEPYRYGGMAYRGPEPFVKGKLDVLTSEGKHRVDGDQKPARWVDLTGPVADGSDQYAGAMIADHPSNPHYPTVARIHPTTLPFFCYVPSHDQPLTIAAEIPTVFRYRVLIHDGRPDAKLDDAIARDFAEPPVVTVE
jgi:hypothetical protein